MAKDLVYYATKEIGTSEGITTLANTGGSVKIGDNKTKYGKWYGSNGVAWCHIFVSWCANKAGVLGDLVPKTASCSTGMQWFKDNKRFIYTTFLPDYKPKRNDIIYFMNNYSHVGIVEKVKNGMVYTIEGNSGDKVARRAYKLNNSKITGYGLVSDYLASTQKKTTKTSTGQKNAEVIPTTSTSSGSSSTSSSTSTNTKKNNKANETSKQELAYLNKMLNKVNEQKKTKTSTESVNVEVSSISSGSNLAVKLICTHNGKMYQLPVKDGLQVTWERKGMPGTLSFTTLLSKKYVGIGDQVALIVNKTKFFFGFVFTIKPSKDGSVQIVAYDQLRYFKNKDTYMYKKKTANELLRRIANDFGLKVYGKNPNTKVAVTRIDDNQTLFDIFQNCLDETMWSSGKIYTLYDDYGKLRIRAPWKVNKLLDAETMQDYTYSHSIDAEVYNQVKLAYDNKSTGQQEYYISKNSSAINKWGLLQYYEKIDSKALGKVKSRVLLNAYCKTSKTLTVTGCFGSTAVRAGCLIPTVLKLYDTTVNKYMLVDKVIHTFNNSQHTMDLVLSGGDFDTTE